MDNQVIVTIVPTRKVVAVIINGVPHPLFADTTDVNVISTIKPLLTFTDFTWGFAGPKDRSTAIVEQIQPEENSTTAGERVTAKIAEFNANVREGL